MHLMQYEIEIPPGYDIRKRIEVRGHSTDNYPDLGLKAYCITDTHYSPFYFWRQPGGDEPVPVPRRWLPAHRQ
jgi:hypothetical protein